MPVQSKTLAKKEQDYVHEDKYIATIEHARNKLQAPANVFVIYRSVNSLMRLPSGKNLS